MTTFTRRILIGIIVCYILGFFAHAYLLKKTVYGDGIFYYSWVRSVVIDRDINFANDYAHFGVIQPKTKFGTFGNKYSVGPALFWAPLFSSVHTWVRGNGWTLPYQLSVGITSVLAAIAGLVLLTRLLRKSPGATALTILLIAGATNLLFYGSLDPVNSHALTFFVATVFLSLTLSEKPNSFALGIFLALLASIRLQDAVYILLLIPIRKHIRVLPFLSGCILAFSPQLIAWYALYGTFANPYLAGGEGFNIFHANILGVLFAPRNGLFLWTPIVGIGVAGLIYNSKKYWPYLAVWTIELLIVASWGTWWQGTSVSGRMFVSTLPIIALGLHMFIERVYNLRPMRFILPLLACSLCLINTIGIVYYLITN
jgi:hypothetical protein